VPVLQRRHARRTTGAEHGAERIWIHGDLHVENFGTYLNSDGRLIFDVNDFDEAYLGRFTLGPAALRASLALIGLAEGASRGRRAQLMARYCASYLAQVNHYVGPGDDDDFALRLDNAHGPVLARVETRSQPRGRTSSTRSRC
jgi:uncharacterized protein (DUF2252 family)